MFKFLPLGKNVSSTPNEPHYSQKRLTERSLLNESFRRSSPRIPLHSPRKEDKEPSSSPPPSASMERNAPRQMNPGIRPRTSHPRIRLNNTQGQAQPRGHSQSKLNKTRGRAYPSHLLTGQAFHLVHICRRNGGRRRLDARN